MKKIAYYHTTLEPEAKTPLRHIFSIEEDGGGALLYAESEAGIKAFIADNPGYNSLYHIRAIDPELADLVWEDIECLFELKFDDDPEEGPCPEKFPRGRFISYDSDEIFTKVIYPRPADMEF